MRSTIRHMYGHIAVFGNKRAGRFTGGIGLLFLAFMAAACVPVDVAAQRCVEFGGRYEFRPLPNNGQGVIPYCVFADGTECWAQQFIEGTCMPPGAIAPLSPLPFESSYLPPSTLGDLIRNSPLIIVGTVGSVPQYETFCGYADDGITVLPCNGSPGQPATDYVLHVERVIRDDGTIARGEPVVLRMPGHITEDMKEATAGVEFPFSYPGERRLFLLSPSPDGENYSFRNGPWSRLIIDDDMLRISNATEDPLRFQGEAELITLEQFITFVENSASE